MKFIGRRRELESLETAYQTDGGFVVIYGRRRVGKSSSKTSSLFTFSQQRK